MPINSLGQGFVNRSKERRAYEKKLIAKGIKTGSSKMSSLICRKFR